MLLRSDGNIAAGSKESFQQKKKKALVSAVKLYLYQWVAWGDLSKADV